MRQLIKGLAMLRKLGCMIVACTTLTSAYAEAFYVGPTILYESIKNNGSQDITYGGISPRF